MKTKRRKPWLALLLSIFCVPVGYVYAGDPKKGVIVSTLILLLFPASILLTKIALSVAVLACIVLFLLLFSLAILVDVYRSAKGQPMEYKMRFFNTWWMYICVYVVFSLVFFPLAKEYTKENLVQAYKIPAGSMLPTLLIGDHFFVDKRSYKTQKIGHEDLIIFPFPKKPETDYIKRVIGLPGDEVEIRNKQVYLNKIIKKQRFATYTDPGILSQADSPRDNFGPVTVPEDAVFVLGDNRDNSYDSRFWGFVPTDTVKGKVVNIYWSWDRSNSQVRWERIGLKVD